MGRVRRLSGTILLVSGLAFLSASVYLAVVDEVLASILSLGIGLVLSSMGVDLVRED